MRCTIVLATVLAAFPAAAAEDASTLDALIRAYPDFLAGREGTVLIWRDGTRMEASDGRPEKSFDEQLSSGSILDQMRTRYRPGPGSGARSDAGRVRNWAFFDKMYGDCAHDGVQPHLVSVPWLPNSGGGTLRVTSINGVATQLEAVSCELDMLPAEDKRFLYPVGGGFSCRLVHYSEAPSMHRWGAAIDINVAHSDYWQWHHRIGGDPGEPRVTLPQEIVAIFEKHGFIWGGKWSHFDTMHFEYRPELLAGE